MLAFLLRQLLSRDVIRGRPAAEGISRCILKSCSHLHIMLPSASCFKLRIRHTHPEHLDPEADRNFHLHQPLCRHQQLQTADDTAVVDLIRTCEEQTST